MEQDDWRSIATSEDRDRIRRWRTAFVQALGEVQPAQAGAIAHAAPLLAPDAALAAPTPIPGEYRCRTAKLSAGSAPRPGLAFTAPTTCRITADGAGGFDLAVTSGPQRPQGHLYPDDPTRMIFLGTMMLGDEPRPLRYGRDGERDMAGTFERIGPDRWRLVLPFPHWESVLAVIELTRAD